MYSECGGGCTHVPLLERKNCLINIGVIGKKSIPVNTITKNNDLNIGLLLKYKKLVKNWTKTINQPK